MKAIASLKDFGLCLLTEARSFYFLILVILAGMMLYQDIAFHLDGAVFILYDFFEAAWVNSHDFTRLAGIVGTHWAALFYAILEGENFNVMVFLFKLGHVLHIFFPVFFLVYLKYKNPEATAFVRQGIAYYVCSQLIYRSLCYLFLVSEVHIAHSLTWMIIFAYQARRNFPDNTRFKENCIWTFSILAAFTYPLSIFTFAMLFAAEFIRQNRKTADDTKEDFRLFFAALLILNLGLLYYYLQLFPQGEAVIAHVVFLKKNNYTKICVFTFVLIFILRPVFKYQNVVLCAIFAIIYYKKREYFPWHVYADRAYGTMAIILLQAYYLYFSGQERIDKFCYKARPYLVYLLMVCFLQGQNLDKFYANLLQIMRTQPGVIDYDVVEKKHPRRLQFYHYEWNIRTLSAVLQIYETGKVSSIVNPHPERSGGLLHNWGTEGLHSKLKSKNIQYDPQAIIIKY